MTPFLTGIGDKFDESDMNAFGRDGFISLREPGSIPPGPVTRYDDICVR